MPPTAVRALDRGGNLRRDQPRPQVRARRASMRPRLFTQPDGLTRRGLLQAGGLAGAAAFVGGRPWSPESAAAAAAADDGTPAHLLRSSYVSIKDPSFVVGNATQLQLVAVSDLPAASVVSELAGSEDAFALTL